MNKSLHKPIIGKAKTRNNYGVMDAPELMGKSWDTPDINWFIRILSYR